MRQGLVVSLDGVVAQFIAVLEQARIEEATPTRCISAKSAAAARGDQRPTPSGMCCLMRGTCREQRYGDLPLAHLAATVPRAWRVTRCFSRGTHDRVLSKYSPSVPQGAARARGASALDALQPLHDMRY